MSALARRRRRLAQLLLAVSCALSWSAPVVQAAASRFDRSAVQAESDDPGVDEHDRQRQFYRDPAGGELDADGMKRMWDAARALRSEAPAAINSVNSWTLAGPVFSTNVGGGFITGRVRDIDALHTRALAASGGLWKFDVFGGVPLCDSVPASWFGSFATRPTDANTILLGTGEYTYGGPGTGMYRTTDGGATWSPVTMPSTPSSFSRVRWSSDGAIAYAASGKGLFRSADGGVTWLCVLTGDVSDVFVVSDLPGNVLATQVGTGVWRSIDGGLTWGEFTANGAPVGLPGHGAVTAALSSQNNQLWIYAAYDAVIYRSQNAGATWSNVTPANFVIGNSGYGPAISVCPTDPNTVLYGNVPLVRTTDGGVSWTKIALPTLHADFHVFAWDADNTGVWAGHDGGWSHSTDKGATWSSSSNAMPISQFYSIDCEKTELGYMIGGTQDNNVLYTPNPSLTWVDPALNSTEGDAFGVVIDLYSPTSMWAVSGQTNGPITYPRFRTTDGGTTWSQVTSGIGPSTLQGQIRSDNAYPVRLVTSAGTLVYESLDGGSTWTQNNPVAFPANISDLTSSTRVSPSAVLYATLGSTTSGQRLYVRDGGTWSERSSGLPLGQVVKVVPHPWAANADEAWAVMSTSTQQIWHTTDRGQTWTNVTGDFPVGVTVKDLVPNPRHVGEWYVGSVLGCYRTRNGGVNWEHWNNGMPPAAIVSEMTYIDLTSTTGQFFVVAATFGRSVWKRDVSGDDPVPTVSASNVIVQEGDSGQNLGWFRLTLSQAQPNTVSVNYATQDSTATVADNDYVATSSTATFLAGQTSLYVNVLVNGDTRVEPDEQFKLVLSNPVGASLGNGGVCTLLDDDSRGLTSRDLSVTDGVVNAIASSGSRIFIGGSFSHVGAASGSAVPLDATSGVPSALPRVDGRVYAVLTDGVGGWYLGGAFAHVGGVPRPNLAHVLADGSVDAWNPVTDGTVYALAKSGSMLYAGGSFAFVGGQAHAYLAGIPVWSNRPVTWDPALDGQVLALAASADGTTLYAGGSFTHAGADARGFLAALTTASGAATAWNPLASADVDALLLDGGLLYVGGSFATIGGQSRHGLAALSTTSALATAWNPAPDNPVYALAADAGAIYAGGSFANAGGQPRVGLVALDRTSGQATAWSPATNGSVSALAVSGATLYAGGAFTSIGGQARANLGALGTSDALATSWDPQPNSSVYALGVNGTVVFAGGGFTSLAAQARANLAAFDATSGALLPWNPGTNGAVHALAMGPGAVLAGGAFTSVGGLTRNRIAALDTLSGVATTWDPNANNTVRSLLYLASSGRVLAGGTFTSIGGQARSRIAALSASNATATAWNPNANGTVYALATDGTNIYIGGTFTSVGGAARQALAALNGTSGAALSGWAPDPNNTVYSLLVSGSALYLGGAFTQVAATSRPHLAAIDLSKQTLASWNPAPNDIVYALAPNGTSEVYVGGAFTVINGVTRNRLALLRPGTSSVANWAPSADADVNALMVNGSALWLGGAFTSLAGCPQAHVGRLIPEATVDVPLAPRSAAFAVSVSPNPSRGRVRVDFDLPEATRVQLRVLDLQGRRVGPVVDEPRLAGSQRLLWDGAGARGVGPGVYFLHLSAGSRQAVRRVVIF